MENRNPIFELLRRTSRLHETDNLAIEYADGELSEEDFAKLKEERKKLKAEIETLKGKVGFWGTKTTNRQVN